MHSNALPRLSSSLAPRILLLFTRFFIPFLVSRAHSLFCDSLTKFHFNFTHYITVSFFLFISTTLDLSVLSISLSVPTLLKEAPFTFTTLPLLLSSYTFSLFHFLNPSQSLPNLLSSICYFLQPLLFIPPLLYLSVFIVSLLVLPSSSIVSS